MAVAVRRALCVLVLSAGVSLASTTHAQDLARMDQVVTARTTGPAPFMGAVLVAQGSRMLLDKGYGLANMEWRIPASPTTRFRLGSVTKQFTAAAILLLEQEGRLSVSDLVSDKLPDAPAAWAGMTIDHLLTHTSGIPNYTAFPDYERVSIAPVTTRQLVDRFRDSPLDFPPGTEFRYSNSGYAVLGLVIETVSGQSYAEFVQRHIFEKLGMADSGYDSHAAVIEQRASGYAPGPSGLRNAAYLDMSVPHAAGGLFSTTHDLLTWQRALYGGTLLSKASLEKMTTPRLGGYAYGLTVPAGAKRPVVQHGGGINGFATMLAYYPTTETSVVVLSNVVGPAAAAIAADLGALAHGDIVQLPSERTEITLTPEALGAFVGTYQHPSGALMYIRLTDGAFTGQIVGQPQVALFAETPTRFFLKVVDAQIDFVRDAGGAVTHLVLHQNGASIEWTRTGATPPPVPAPRVAITVDRAVLERYPGVYELKPGFDLTVSLGDGGLMAQATGQGAFPLSAESPTRFFFEPASITLEFVSGADGAITHMLFEQGGGKTEARRKP